MKTLKHNRIFSILLAVAMLVSMLPVGMVSASAVSLDQEYVFLVPNGTATLTSDESVTLVSSDEDVVTVAGGVITAVGAGTATVTANDGEATAYVVVDDNPHYYYNLAKGYKGTSSSAVIPFADMGYARTLKGSPSEATCNNDRYFESDPWRAGTVYGTTTTEATTSFPVGGAQTTMDLRGYNFKVPAEGDYFSVIVNVPAAGTYDIQFNHAKSATTAAPTISYAAAGVGVEGATELGVLDSINTVLKDNCTTTFEAIELTAGEYEIFFVGPCEVFWCDAIELINAEASYPVFAYPSVEATYGEVITPLHTGTEGYTPVLTTDSDLVTINDDGTITCGNESGIATVTLSTEEFPTAIATMTISIGSSMYFDYMKTHLLVSDEKDPDTGKQLEPLLSTLDITCENTKSFTASDIGSGTYVSYGWEVGTKSSGISRDWIWSSSARSMGPYFAGAVGSYTSMVIDVPVDGEFAVISKHSPWTGANNAAYDVYIAPSDAADPVAAEYKLTSAPISNQSTIDGNHDYGREDFAGIADLTAGRYIVSYKVTTQGNGFFIMGLKLKNALDPADATELTLPETFMAPVGTPVSLGAATVPAEAIVGITYESSDDNIATVDEKGMVTGVAAGTAIITATSPSGLTATTTVQTYVAYDYLIKACATDFKSDTTFQSEDYAGSLAVPGCAPFRYVTGNAGAAVSGDATYGSFFGGTYNGTNYVQFEVELEAGVYDAVANIVSYGNSAPANVYLAPVGSTVETEENLIISIPTGGYSSATKVRVEGDTTIAVEGGKYTLFFRQVAGSELYRYLCMDSFHLRKVAEVTVESFDLTTDSAIVSGSKMLKVDESVTLTATNIVPSFETIDGAAWTSSDDNIATVADGVVTAVAAGDVTITAEVDGVSASIDLTVVEKSYDYLFKSFTGVNFMTNTSFAVGNDYAGSQTVAGCAPFEYITAVGIFSQNNDYGCFIGHHTSETDGESDAYARIKIKVDGGKYVGVADVAQYGSTATADVFIAPYGDTANYENSANKLMTIDNTDRPTSGIKRVIKADSGVLNLPAGEYTLTFRLKTYRYLTLNGFHLYKVGDFTAESFDVNTDDAAIAVNGTANLSVSNVLPAFTPTAEEIEWTSSDDQIATVDANGVVTGVAPGVATITAEIYGATSTVNITVYDSVLEYEFYEVGKAYNGTGKGATVFKDVAAFKDGYDASQSTSADSAPWMLVSSSGLFQSADTYGTFMLGSQNGTIDSVVLKIKVAEDGKYVPASLRHTYNGSTPATVHIAPVDADDKTAQMYYVYTITEEDTTGVTVEEVADTAIMLKAGEYYLSFQHAVPSTSTDRYLCLYDFKLYNVGDYEAVKAESVTVSADLPAIAIGETTIMAHTVLPALTENKVVTWSSSDDTIATVDAATGVVTGKGNGIVTITGTTTDGSDISASYDIVVGGTYTYDFVKSITGQADYTAGATYAVKDTTLSVDYQDSIDAGSDPWYLDTRSTNASHAEISYNSVNAAYGAFFFGTVRSSTAYLRLKIRVDESGVYTGAIRYADYNSSAPTKIYLAPVSEEDTLVSEANMIFDIPHNYAAITQEALTTEGLNLRAGEYYLYFQQCGDPSATTVEHRYFTTHYFSLTKTDDLNIISIVDGAQMRTSQPQGLRFIASIDKTHVDYEEEMEYGIVLLPAADIAEGDELTADYVAANGHKVAVVPAVNMYTTTDYANTFTAVLINIPPASYSRKIAARAYAIVDGNYVYSDLTVERSIYEIAQLIIADEEADQDDKTAAQAVVDAVNAQ